MVDPFDVILFSKSRASKNQKKSFFWEMGIKTGLFIHTENVTRPTFIIIIPFVLKT